MLRFAQHDTAIVRHDNTRARNGSRVCVALSFICYSLFAILHSSPASADEFTTVREETQVELARWSTGNALLVGTLVAISALYAVGWMYRREGRGDLTRRVRMFLVGCRAAVLLTLGAIGLEPVLVNYIHRKQAAVSLVLVDSSASMGLADHYPDAPDAERVEKAFGSVSEAGVERISLAAHLLNDSQGGLLPGLAQRNRVKTFAFSNVAKEVAMSDAASAGSGRVGNAHPTVSTEILTSADGPATNIGAAVRSAVDSIGAAPVAAVIVLTDGGFNQGEDPTTIGRFLEQKGVPLYAVGIGDPVEPVNARVTDISAPHAAFKNDPFVITIRIDGTRLDGQSVRVELLERRTDRAGLAQPVESRVLAPRTDGSFAPIEFERKIAEPGLVTYAAHIEPLSGEAVLSDNRREIMPAIQVLDDKMRVLLIAGGPSYDYRFLTRLLERDESIDVSTWLQSADPGAVRDGDTILTELPVEPVELFKYDAVLLLDCDPDMLDTAWCERVAALVTDHGGGVLFEAGNKYTSRFMRTKKTSAITEILPIVPDEDAEILLNELGHYQTKAWPIQIPEKAAGDPILRLIEDPDTNRDLWSALPGVFWHFPVRREKPVASVLMRHSNPRMANTFGPHVLFATQYVGAGRTAFLGFNSSWRWRRGNEKLFDRFWIQTLRHLVEGKLLGGRKRAIIFTEKDRFDVGESIAISVRALDERFNPLQLPELEMRANLQPSDDQAAGAGRPNNADGVILSGAKNLNPSSQEGAPDGGVEMLRSTQHDTTSQHDTTITLTPTPGRDGYYQGRFMPDGAGVVRLTLALPGAADSVAPADATASREVYVLPPNLELQEPAMQRDRLRQFVRSAGEKARYFEIDEAREIAKLIDDQSRTFIIRERPRPLWDNRYTLALLVGLLTLEWIVRKKAKLL